MACIVTFPGQSITDDELKDYLKDKFASWWIPERYITMEQIPKTSVGKFNKRELRQMYADGKLA